MSLRTIILSTLTIILSTLLVITSAAGAFASPQLVMVEEDGCMWCARWNEEISEIYPKTGAGKAAPLRRMDIRADLPDDLEFKRKLFFTPTFVLMVEGAEVARIEGYPGEDFFWGLLEKMLLDANIEISE